MILILMAFVLGIIGGFTEFSLVVNVAHGISRIFVNILELISIPLIFLSIASTITGMTSIDEMKKLGKKVLKYTLFTTIVAASIALLLFVIINPVREMPRLAGSVSGTGTLSHYFSFLAKIVPSNLVQLFGDNANVAGVVFFAILLSLSILTLPKEQKNLLQSFFSSFFAAILKITSFVLVLMPIAVWSFVTIFVTEIGSSFSALTNLVLYFVVLISANLIQGFIVLPLFLKYKGFNPQKVFKGMSEALTVAFFSKSSSTALPLTLKCAKQKLGVSDRVASFSLPLCSTINMNGCAAFILVTVLFVGMSNGFTFSFLDMVLWIFIATAAAVGNAGVPMGCYFLASAFLASMDIPLYLLGAILPAYALIDMIETALNVWSDSCVTVVVDKEV